MQDGKRGEWLERKCLNLNWHVAKIWAKDVGETERLVVMATAGFRRADRSSTVKVIAELGRVRLDPHVLSRDALTLVGRRLMLTQLPKLSFPPHFRPFDLLFSYPPFLFPPLFSSSKNNYLNKFHPNCKNIFKNFNPKTNTNKQK